MEDRIQRLKRITDSISPVIFLDFLFELRKNATRIMIYFLISAGVIITTFYMQLSAHGDSHEGVFSSLIVIICVISAVIGGTYAAGAIAREKEKKTLTLLRMSGISGFEIIFGKVMSAMIYMLMISSPYLLLAFLVRLFGDFDLARLTGGLFMWLTLTFFYISSGVFISMLFKKNASANSCLYFFLFAQHFLIYLLDEVTGYRERFSHFSYNSKFFSSLSPVEIWQDFFLSASNNSSYKKTLIEERILTATPDYVVICGIYLLMSLLIIFFSANVFEKYLRWRED